MFRPFSQNLKGVEVGSLDRFFENNTFYKKPKVTDKIEGNGEIISNNTIMNFPDSKKYKVELPDPFTFATLCENLYYKDFSQLLSDIGNVLKQEIKTIIKSGCDIIQFNAPSLTQVKDNDIMNQIRDIYKEMLAGVNIETYVNVYFSDIKDVYKHILDFKVYGIGIDLINSNINEVKEYGVPKSITFGCINAQNTLLENPKNIANNIRKILEQIDITEYGISTNCDLEFVPEEFAQKKVHIIGNTLKILKDGK